MPCSKAQDKYRVYKRLQQGVLKIRLVTSHRPGFIDTNGKSSQEITAIETNPFTFQTASYPRRSNVHHEAVVCNGDLVSAVLRCLFTFTSHRERIPHK